ncbi:ABC transporter ATP-binding protein [Dactylosporangium sp. NPDC000555]|uniref:ABC transporter ATP-binding protein n=1 Tax=Dactylosporangium sp. NPDC000555 TaxID=3154260 RepID=UPI0033183444
MTTVLEIEGVSKKYGDHEVLIGVDLVVRPGQILGLLGANGAGKTTLVSIAAGLRTADAGKVRIAGVDAVSNPREAQAHMGIAPQELGIYPTLTVADNLGLFARLAGMKGAAVRQRVEQVAELLGLTEKLKKQAVTLSGGQKRRLHTGMAILHRPDVLFLDEPTVGADVQSRAGILGVVRELAQQGSAVVYTTHYMTELEQLDADIAVLHQGRIVESGTIDELVARHSATKVVLQFDSPAPRLAAGDWTVEGNTLVSHAAAADLGASLVGALTGLGPAAADLTGVELRRASLESAFVAITGGAIEAHGEELKDVVPA